MAKFAKAASTLPNCHSSQVVDGNNDHREQDADRDDDNETAAAANDLLEEFEYESSFPEFASALRIAQESLYELIGTTILPAMRTMHPDEDPNKNDDEYNYKLHGAGCDIHDPLLWEEAADVCDRLVEQVEDYLEQSQQDGGDPLSSAYATGKILSSSSKAFRETAASQWAQIQRNTRQDIPKPQDLYQIPIDNKRTTPFIPSMLELLSHKPNAIEPLPSDWMTTAALLPGHGYDSRWGELKKSSITTTTNPTQDRRIAPSVHCPHPYETEIRSFSSSSSFLASVLQDQPPANIYAVPEDAMKAEWVDTVEALEQCSAQIARAQVIAVDLEAHSHRTFAGITCLMQISIRDSDPNNNNKYIRNYLIDVLKLPRSAIHQAFIGPFTDPNIVKVFHGADMDIQWLQRDFHLYVVNLFDTGRAARALRFPSASYAHLLSRYVQTNQDHPPSSSGVVSNKQVGQLADWRVRPLPPELIRYAIADTHYLLDIYEHILYDLHHSDECSIQEVVDTSSLVSLIRYVPAPFDSDGYHKLLPRYRRHRRNRRRLRLRRGNTPGNDNNDTARSETVENHEKDHPDDFDHDNEEDEDLVLRALWDWRDQTARDHDESVHYVCTEAQLLRIANCCHRNNNNNNSGAPNDKITITPAQIRALFHPMPPLIAACLPDIIRVVQNAQEIQLQNESVALSAGADEGDMESEKEEDELGAAVGGVGDDDEVMGLRETSASAFFQPASNTANTMLSSNTAAERHQHRGGMMSPVLGTKALYEQAGWMTPSSATPIVRDYEDEEEEDEEVGIVADWTTTDDDDDDDKAEDGDNKPRKLLSVHSSNQQFKSASAQSMDLGARAIQEEHGGIDHAASSSSNVNSSITPLSLDDEVSKQAAARKNASRIKSNMDTRNDAIPAVLGLVASSKGDDDDDDDDDLPTSKKKTSNPGDNEDLEEDFIIPRSIREIYMISNRNRRNKKTGSPTPEQGATPTSEKEREELARAEALLKERGDAVVGYFSFDADTSPGKRPRTKSGRESEESVPDPGHDVVSREEDVAFMKEIGWIQSKEEVEGMLNQRARTRGIEIGGRNAGLDAGDDRARYDATAIACNNPFFSGAPVHDGGLFRQQHSFVKPEQLVRPSNKSGSVRGKPKRRERPEKKENRTHAYRKR